MYGRRVCRNAYAEERPRAAAGAVLWCPSGAPKDAGFTLGLGSRLRGSRGGGPPLVMLASSAGDLLALLSVESCFGSNNRWNF